jgi:hypothetical protein
MFIPSVPKKVGVELGRQRRGVERGRRAAGEKGRDGVRRRSREGCGGGGPEPQPATSVADGRLALRRPMPGRWGMELGRGSGGGGTGRCRGEPAGDARWVGGGLGGGGESREWNGRRRSVWGITHRGESMRDLTLARVRRHTLRRRCILVRRLISWRRICHVTSYAIRSGERWCWRAHNLGAIHIGAEMYNFGAVLFGADLRGQISN